MPDADAWVLDSIAAIYEAVEEPALWPSVLDGIARELSCAAYAFTIEDIGASRSSIALANSDPVFLTKYNQHYHSVNPHMKRARHLLTPGRVIASNEVCSDKETLHSEYYTDFLRPQGWFYVFGGAVANEQSLVSVANFVRTKRAGGPSAQDLESLSKLMPHLRRAAKLRQTLDGSRAALSSLDSLSTAALLVGASCRVHFMNRSAEEIAERKDGIWVERGVLRTAERRLATLLNQTCTTGAGIGPLALPRPSGKRPYVAMLAPLKWSALQFGLHKPMAMLFITDPEKKPEKLDQLLQQLFRLSPSEAAVCALLIAGHDLNGVCAIREITRATARTHLKNAFEKLGVKRQSELTALLSRAFGAFNMPAVSRTLDNR